MKIIKFSSTTLLLILASSICSAQFEQSTIHMNDGTVLKGLCKIPKMLDKNIVYKELRNSSKTKLNNENIDSILFEIDDSHIKYVREITSKGYANKKLNKRKSWLKIEIDGFVTLYKGIQTQMGSPKMNLWYCKKANEKNAFFITNKYSGGMVMTLGNKKLFKKYASQYFKDNVELVQKINSEYSNKDLLKVVTDYNEWISLQ